MPVEITITESDPQFFEALRNPAGFMPILGEAMKNIMDAYEKKASEYAPESEANHPGRFSLSTHKPMGYYERGRGWWYPLTTHNTLGLGGEQAIMRHSVKAPKTLGVGQMMAVGIMGVTGYRLRETSEQMGEKWATDVEVAAEEVIGYLRNRASYSDLVQGLGQIQLHKARDWQTIIQSWETPEVQNVVSEETMNAIDTYYHL